MATTIKDIARIAGVSIGTVSNYINGKQTVLPETAERIRQAISETSYEPNYIAKDLRTHQSNNIGVLLPDFDNPFYVRIYQGIESVISKSSHLIQLFLTHDNPKYEKECIQILLRKQIDGIILVPSIFDDWEFYYRSFISSNKPVVLLDRAIDKLDISFITCNYDEIIKNLVSLLIANSLTNIVLVTGSKKYNNEIECINSFRTVCSNNQIHLKQSNVITDINSKEDAFRAVINLMPEHKPDAFIVTSENVATGIVEALLFLGYRNDVIPVLSIGEDSWNEKTHSVATLSTKRPAYQIGKKAANIILEHIQHPIHDNSRIIFNDRLNNYTEIFLNKIVKPVPSGNFCASDKIKVLMLETPQTYALLNLLDNFSDLTGIKPDVEIVEHRKLFKRIQNEQHSDVFMFDIPWLETLVQLDLITDISEYILASNLHDSIFFPYTTEYFSRIDDKIYGLPFMHAVQILYYRKDIFENNDIKRLYRKMFHSSLRLPETWREFDNTAKFFSLNTEEIPYGISVPGAYPECLLPEIYLRFFSYDNNIFSRNNKVVFDNPKSLMIYTQFMHLLQVAKPGWRNANDEDVVKDFLNKETAMLISYPSFLNEILLQSDFPLEIKDIGFSQTPKNTPILGGWGMGISPASSKRDESFVFVEWACTDMVSNYLTLMGGFTAVENTYQNDELMNIFPWFSSYRLSYKQAKPILPPKKVSGGVVSQQCIDEILYTYFMEMLDGKISIPEAIRRTQSGLQKLFAP